MGTFRKVILLTNIILLTACQAKTLPADNTVTSLEPVNAKYILVTEDQVSFKGYPQMTDYDTITAMGIESEYEEQGVFAGSPAIWNVVNDGNFIYFYYTLDNTDQLKPKYADYAIIGEDIVLSCGIHTGMTAAQADEILPGLYRFNWESPGAGYSLDWNPNRMPRSWCRQFPQVLIAEVDNGNEMPLIVGLFLDEQEIIRAIAFNCPTAG